MCATKNRCGFKQVQVKTGVGLNPHLFVDHQFYLSRNKKQGGVYIGAGLNPHLYDNHQLYLSLTQKKQVWV